MNKIKNYSTSVSAERSIAEIEKILALFGAEAIMKEYLADGRVRGLQFKLNNKIFKLPANVNGVREAIFAGKRKYYGRDTMKGRDTRAYNVTWRILKDWIHAQLSLIASGQAHPQEIFLPYLFDGERTLYQIYAEGRLLTSGKPQEEVK
jgi:hypothetical protein